MALVSVHIADGSKIGSDFSLVVTAGKRLVGETVAMYRSSSSGLTAGQSVKVFLDAAANGGSSAFPLPSVPATTAFDSGTTQALRFYADPGTQISLFAERTGTSGNEFDEVTVCGYLVDVP